MPYPISTRRRGAAEESGRARPLASPSQTPYSVDREQIVRDRLVLDSSVIYGPVGHCRGLPLVGVLDGYMGVEVIDRDESYNQNETMRPLGRMVEVWACPPWREGHSCHDAPRCTRCTSGLPHGVRRCTRTGGYPARVPARVPAMTPRLSARRHGGIEYGLVSTLSRLYHTLYI